jgi:hypothetical protein
MQISDIFHNCPEEQQQQCNPKDLGSKFPWSKTRFSKICILLPVHLLCTAQHCAPKVSKYLRSTECKQKWPFSDNFSIEFHPETVKEHEKIKA